MDKDKLIVFEEKSGIVDLREKITKEITENDDLTKEQKKSLKNYIEDVISQWVLDEVVECGYILTK